MFSIYDLFFFQSQRRREEVARGKVKDTIASAVIHQNYCDHAHNPILVADSKLLRFWKRKYHLIFSFRAVATTSWGCEYGFLKSHLSSPAMLTPDDADIPSVFSVNQEFYDERIKTYLKETPSVY